ncbi:hypothetical protein [Cellulophaga tyrosinoxydans]|uniref:Uncharacterized protein n=1 Tax=Cellulophaga tyrosinoxydans TaxID=504486 RepID=A0A1W2BGM9_9FLAO|nr:hypothetical protein [Cellulophaga tyrosinoxydans]SMC72004.1 hypothetical protein SAMN05660703_2391 [Cellulophaga tyrosinoxydans]
MEFKKQFGKSILGLLLFAIFLMPTVIQFSHVLEGHKHTICTDNSTHIDAKVTKCEICDFHFVVFNYEIIRFPELIISVPPRHIETNIVSINFKSFNLTHKQLRAPPKNS